MMKRIVDEMTEVSHMAGKELALYCKIVHKTHGDKVSRKKTKQLGGGARHHGCGHHHGQPVVVAVQLLSSCLASATLPLSL